MNPSFPHSHIPVNGSRRKPYIDRSPIYSAELKVVVDRFQSYMYMPDPAPFVLSMATIVANRMNGSPVWSMLIGPPSSGKSEILNTVIALDKVIEIASLSEAGLLSGSEKPSKDATGGLLRQFGSSGTMVAKDFTTIMAMHPHERDKVLAILREIYDGRWIRHIGSVGGKQLQWKGKLGFLGGVTEIIDVNRHVLSSMGDRFVYIRMEAQPSDLIVNRVLNRNGHGEASRIDIQDYVYGFIESLEYSIDPAELSPDDQYWIHSITDVSAIARSPVERDNRSRLLVEVMNPESPGRLAGSLGQLFSALIALGCSYTETRRLLQKIAVDCIPYTRSRLLTMMAKNKEGLTVEAMRQDTRVIHPETSVRRALEDLEHLMMVEKYIGAGNLQHWKIKPDFLGFFQ